MRRCCSIDACKFTRHVFEFANFSKSYDVAVRIPAVFQGKHAFFGMLQMFSESGLA